MQKQPIKNLAFAIKEAEQHEKAQEEFENSEEYQKYCKECDCVCGCHPCKHTKT